MVGYLWCKGNEKLMLLCTKTISLKFQLNGINIIANKKKKKGGGGGYFILGSSFSVIFSPSP